MFETEVATGSNHGRIISAQCRRRAGNRNSRAFLHRFAQQFVGRHASGDDNTLYLVIPSDFDGLGSQHINHSFLNVGNDKHRTSLEILDVKGSQVRFRKGLDIVTTRVVAVDEAEGVVTGRLVSILMGTQEDNGMTPGMTDGLWATNDAMTKWWKCTYTGGTRQDGYTYKLTPVDVPGIASGPVTKKDFPLQGALRIWELGPTDTIRLETFVNVRRFPLDDRIYEVTANVPCRVGLPADKALKGYEMSSDRVTWTPIEHQNVKGLWQFDLTEKQLETDCYLRPAK